MLPSLRDFQDDKADVNVKYTADEARTCASFTRFSACLLLMWFCLQSKCIVNCWRTRNSTSWILLGEEDGECTFEFGDEGEVDTNDINLRSQTNLDMRLL